VASLMGGLGGGREYVLKIVADVKDAVKGVDEVADKTTSMKDKMVGIGQGVAAGLAGAAVIEFGKDCINAAADADDAMDLVNAAFGTSSKEIENFAKGAADNMGMSTSAYETMASKTGSLLQSMGISQQDAVKQTETMSQRAADMAAIWGTDVPTAMDAMNKAMTGKTKGLEQFGVKISTAEVNARAMSKGYVDASGKVTDAGRAIAAQELILERTSNVQGAWAANSKDLGSQQDIMAAKVQNLKETIGSQLLPIIVKLMETFAPIITFLSQNAGWLLPLAGLITGIVVAMKAWQVIQVAWNAVTAAATAVQWAFNAAMAANPIGLIIIGIAAVIAAIVLLYTKVDWFRAAVDAAIDGVVAAFQWLWDMIQKVYEWVKNNWPLLLAIITGPFGAAVWAIQHYWDQIVGAAHTVIGGIQNAFNAITDILTWPFKQAWYYIQQVPGWIANAFHSLWGGINNAMSGLADAITYPFRKAFDAIKWLWNSTVGGFGFTVPSWVPGIGGKGWSIPEMATGGIVTKPTIALIGERGAEAVVPLTGSNAPQFVQQQPVVINVYALTATSEVGRQVYNALREYERVSGNTI
jgi:hypothetical protein